MEQPKLKLALQELKTVLTDGHGILESIHLLLETMDEAGEGNITISSGPIIIDITHDNIVIGHNDDYGETDVVSLCELSLS